MQVDVAVDYKANTVTQVGTPTFYIDELTEVYTSRDGGGVGATSRRPEGGWKFSTDEWEKVYESGGDFGKIGITILDDPLPGFDTYVAATRKPRKPISLLDAAIDQKDASSQ